MTAARLWDRTALRPGRTAALVVLCLWAARQAIPPLLLLGLIAGWVAGWLNAESDVAAAFDTIGGLLGSRQSPLAGIALAILIRVAVGWLALAAAMAAGELAPSEARSLA